MCPRTALRGRWIVVAKMARNLACEMHAIDTYYEEM
jgi:hypothetical protein